MPEKPVTYDAAFVEARISWLEKMSLEMRQYVGTAGMSPSESFVDVPSGGNTLIVHPGASAAGEALSTWTKTFSESMGNQVGRVIELVIGLSRDLRDVKSLMDRAGELNHLSVEQFLTEFDETVSRYELLRTGRPNTAPTDNKA